MRRITLIIVAIALLIFFAVSISGSAQSNSLPELSYLGEGPGTFETTLDNFIIKVSPFDFIFVEGPTYQAAAGERVWASRGTNQAPPAEWDITVDLGIVEAGCIARYVGVDDDIDDRINSFQLDGEEIEVVTQGLVFGGSFLIPRDGDLTFIANDSVGGYFSPCDERATSTPTPTGTATETPPATVSPTATNTVTPGPSPTATNTATPGPSPTATNTATPGPSPTATNTETPGPSPSATSTRQPPTVEPSATATKRPREHSCVRINFEVGGDEAVRGLYVVQEVGGKLLASWYALDGWQDSGWFKDIDITHENVFVKVLYYSGPNAVPIEMTILNPAPDSQYGWMSWGICHAIEVKWPGEKPAGAMVPEEGTTEAIDQSDPGEISGPEMPPPTPTAETTNDGEDQGSSFGATLNS